MKNIVKTDKAPGAIGPYSQGIDIGNMIFFSGQIPLHPQTGEMPEGIEAQAKQALENVKGLL
ncbi:MAG: RidA family protein, partial [Coprobacillus sp.]|nr:RidA family protein [Coprobacillus sp.]